MELLDLGWLAGSLAMTSQVPFALFPTRNPGFYKLSRLALSPEMTSRLMGIPGIKWNAGGVVVHDTHLPLIDHPVARARMISPLPVDVLDQRRADREALAAERKIVLRSTQHQAIEFLTQRRGALLADDMRVGKGHPSDTLVMTPTGWRPIGQLRVGSQVIGSDGRPCGVTGVFHRGRLPVHRVTFSDGASVLTDSDHLWQVWDHNAYARGGNPTVKSTNELSSTLLYANGNRRWVIPMVSPIQFSSRALPLDPYLLGVLLGDGTFTSSSTSFTSGDDEVPCEVAKVLPAGVKLVAIDCNDTAKGWRLIGPSPRSAITDALMGLWLWGLKSDKKFVPQQYLFASVEQRLALLQGLMDTDGELRVGATRSFVGFDSSSEALTDSVRYLVESLGGVARKRYRQSPQYTYKGEIRIGLPSFRLSISMPNGLSPFRARLGYTERTKFQPTRRIARIEPAGEADVVCISVDAHDRLYVTEHCIVTHNTLSAIWSARPLTDGPLVVIAPLAARAVWLGWLRKTYPDVPIAVLVGRKFDSELLKRQIIFGHFDIIHKWQAIFKIGTLIVDEAHTLARGTTARTLAVSILRSRAERVICLTGTPVWNMPANLHSILNLIAPGAWGDYDMFGHRYGAPEHTAYGARFRGISNEAELHARLGEIMLRRRWVDVQDDLPAISRSVIVAEVSEEDGRKLDVLAGKLHHERSSTASNLAAYRRQVTSLKLAVTIAEAKKTLSRGEPLVIWTWHRDFAEQITTALGDLALLIHGEVVADERERRMDAWRAGPPRALVATMAVGQVAIDLSHARFAIFAELDYTPAVIGQAEMRTYDPTRAMYITLVIANHLVDQRIIRALLAKLSATDPLGVAAAIDSIDALREAVMGPEDHGDLDRLLQDLIGN